MVYIIWKYGAIVVKASIEIILNIIQRLETGAPWDALTLSTGIITQEENFTVLL